MFSAIAIGFDFHQFETHSRVLKKVRLLRNKTTIHILHLKFRLSCLDFLSVVDVIITLLHLPAVPFVDQHVIDKPESSDPG